MKGESESITHFKVVISGWRSRNDERASLLELYAVRARPIREGKVYDQVMFLIRQSSRSQFVR